MRLLQIIHLVVTAFLLLAMGAFALLVLVGKVEVRFLPNRPITLAWPPTQRLVVQ